MSNFDVLPQRIKKHDLRCCNSKIENICIAAVIFKKLFTRYKEEAMPHGESIQDFCLKNKIPYNLFHKYTISNYTGTIIRSAEYGSRLP